MRKATEQIARFIVDTTYDGIQEEEVRAAKWHILDTIGCLLAGSKEQAPEILKRYVEGLGSKKESSIMPWGLKTSADLAALVNGVSAHVLDYDDYEWPSMAHPSVTALPAAMAIGERLKVNGKEFLAGYLVGMEVISKVGKGICPSHYDKGWHSTGTLGTLGAASASAKLFHLDRETTMKALGIAASMSGGLRGNFGTMTKPFHAGHAARSGIEAATLASGGFTADRNILEAELGFCNIFTENKDYDLEKIVTGLGRPFSILSPGLGKKLYPCCAANHSVLDGLFHLIRRHDIKDGDVESVECGIFYLYPKMLIHSEPRTGLEGKFSLEFCVSLALVDRSVRLNDFTDDKVRDPRIQGLIKRVEKYVTEEVGVRGTQYPGALVRVNMKDGRTYSHKVEKRKGSPLNPLSDEEMAYKFMDCAQTIHGRDRAQQILDTVMDMENVDHVGRLADLIKRD